MQTIYIDSITAIRILGARDEFGAGYLDDDDISATMTLYEIDGVTPVPGAEDLPVTYRDGSDGEFRGQIPSTLSLVEGRRYWLSIDIDWDGDVVKKRVICQAEHDDE